MEKVEVINLNDYEMIIRNMPEFNEEERQHRMTEDKDWFFDIENPIYPGLYKYGTEEKEYGFRSNLIAEHIAYKIAEKVGVNVPKVDLAEMHGIFYGHTFGTFNHHVCQKAEEEFIDFRAKEVYASEIKDLNRETIIQYNNKIINYIESCGMLDQFLLGMAYDIYLGNDDRNLGNWGIKKDNNAKSLYFIDNTILGGLGFEYLKCLRKDTLNDNKYVDSDQREYEEWRNDVGISLESYIKFSEDDISLFEFFNLLLIRYGDKMVNAMKTFEERLPREEMEEILAAYDVEILDSDTKEVILEALEERRNKIDEIMYEYEYLRERQEEQEYEYNI